MANMPFELPFELFVALRYLWSLRRETFISVISLFAVFGVCLGVAALIVVLGVMNGFTTDLREKILGVNAHVVVGGLQGPLAQPDEALQKARAVDGVAAATPFIYTEVMLSTRGGVKGVVLRGIDVTSAPGVLSLPEDMISGTLDGLESSPGPHPGIIVGDDLAGRLGVTVGDNINLLAPSGQKSAAGFTPKVKFLTVAGVFSTGMFEYDSSLAYVSLDTARDVLGLGEDAVTGLEIRLADVYAAGNVSEALAETLGGFPYYVRNWMEMNANLFAALKLEKTAMFVILVMIVLVGTFSIVTTLVMLVIQKRRDIAVLMSMGAGAGMVQRVFMLQGTIIGFVGTVLGFALGVPVALLLKKYQFVELPRNVYPVDYLPVLLDPWDLTMIGVSALALCFLATLYPARRAASLEPSTALRYE